MNGGLLKPTINAHCVPSRKGISLTKVQKCNGQGVSVFFSPVASQKKQCFLLLLSCVALRESLKLSELNVGANLCRGKQQISDLNLGAVSPDHMMVTTA